MAPEFVLFGRTFASYGVMCALGVLAALLTALILTRKYGSNLMRVMVLFISGGTGAFAGAMLLHAFVTYTPKELMTLLKSGGYTPGFVYYGGLLGGLALSALAAKAFHWDLPSLARVLVPAVPLAHAIGRAGCFLGGCCYGMLLRSGARLPVQIIESAYELLLFFLLLRLSKRREPRLIRAYLLLYAPFRFVIEFFRGDEVRGFIGVFSTSQVISLILIVFCLSSLVKKRRSA